jgi:hypothetical protein
MNFFKNLFKKKEVIIPPVLSFNIIKADVDIENPYYVCLELKNKEAFLDFLRNTHSELDTTELSDQELTHMYMYAYAQTWLVGNLKQPFFVETHNLMNDGTLRYDRAWNQSFVGAVTNIGFDVLPNSEEELMSMYMNYVYGVRMMEDMEATLESEPASTAHPQMSDPNNKFKG